MTSLLSGHGAIANKNDEQISPYLRRPLRSYQEVRREQTVGKARPVRRKAPTRIVTRDPTDEMCRDEQDDR